MKPKALGAFCYAGGFTEGMKRRFHVATHLENAKPYGAEVARLNHGVTILPHGEWHDFRGAKDPWDACVTFGNAPCAPFSNSGMRAGQDALKWENDDRMDDHRSIVWAGVKAGSDLIVGESVTAAAVRGAAFYESIRPEGYALSFVHHDAARLGIPQRRRRVFVVYHRNALDLAPLAQDLADNVLCEATWRGIPRDGDHRETGRPKLRALVAATPPGMKLADAWHHVPARIQQLGKPSVMSRRLEWGATTPTMAGTYGYGHPSQPRFVTVAEYARICGYPDDYRWPDISATDKVLFMVRAVMPPVAARLADALRGTLQERPLSPQKLKTVRSVKA